jgi:PAS domain S-box-containing protein
MDVATVTPSSSRWFGSRQSREGLPSTVQRIIFADSFPAQLAAVFVAYFVAGKLGQATTTIRSSNLGPVWPAYGIALASLLAYGYRVWPAVAASAFLVAVQGSVSPLAAAGQAAGATIAAISGTYALCRIPHFDPALTRLRDALGLIALGAFASAVLSASIGILSLYATGIQAYSGIGSAWFIYWFGDSTGVLLVTPLVFTLPALFRPRPVARVLELTALIVLLVGACFVVFGDLPLIPIRLHVLALAVLPFVMWAAINFGVAGAALSVFIIATMATVLTALGSGPFAANTPFINAVLLDVLFAVLSMSGLALAAVIAERERAETEREQLIREQAGLEARLRLAAIVETTDDAIVSTDVNDVITSWNAAAERIFGYTEAEALGRPGTIVIPPDLVDEQRHVAEQLKTGERIVHFEAKRLTKQGGEIHTSVTMSPLQDATGALVGAAAISRDITERKRADHALSNVNRRLIEAQEQERRRIARELHDDIGQRLALLNLELTGSSFESSGDRARLATRVSEIAADIQALSHELHAPRLDLLPMSSNMQRFCEDFATRQQATVRFDCGELPDQLPSGVSLGLFRVLQEALHNAAKHSGVREFDVRLWAADGCVHLLIGDGGCGFDVRTANFGDGIGLVSMRERVKLVNGELSIDSQPGRGTSVHARVPHVSAAAPPLPPR